MHRAALGTRRILALQAALRFLNSHGRRETLVDLVEIPDNGHPVLEPA